MNIDVNGVKITLTQEQLIQIPKELDNKKPLTERLFNWQHILDYNNLKEIEILPWNNPKSKEKNKPKRICKITTYKKDV